MHHSNQPTVDAVAIPTHSPANTTQNVALHINEIQQVCFFPKYLLNQTSITIPFHMLTVNQVNHNEDYV